MGVRRPWNIVNVPIYSLATYAGENINMNICTYVSAVSMKPKIYMIAVDYSTHTYEMLKNGAKAVLQLLDQSQINLVKPLGKKTGKNFDKQQYLQKKEHLSVWNGHTVLRDACAYLELNILDQKNIDGDHQLFWFEVKKSKTISEDGILMFQDLINQGIIL